MNTRKQQKLIISLIRDNLINTKLLNGLNKLGLIADDYTLHLSESIFDIMGFEENEQSDKMFEYYLGLLNTVNRIDISTEPEKLSELADTIHWKIAIKKFDMEHR